MPRRAWPLRHRRLRGKATRDLLAEFRSAGGQACFEEIVRRYGAMVLHVCRQVTRDRHDAEDATQVVFLVLAERLRAGETIHSLGTWLQQVARRAAIDIKRSRARRSRRERVRAVAADRDHLPAAKAPAPSRTASSPASSAKSSTASRPSTACRSCCTTSAAWATRRWPASWASSRRRSTCASSAAARCSASGWRGGA